MYRPKPRESDYIQQLADYFKKNLSKGYTSDALKWALINQEHSRAEVDRALKLATEQMASSAPKMIEKPVIKIETIPEVIIEEQSLWSKIKNWFS
ncbi:MAG: hypothetical protein KKB21_04675 [Nanoarchaeota archaeon]|nr:hypothetical protein [Nanoarchaeota archaeon]